jgi:hypothetical protein
MHVLRRTEPRAAPAACTPVRLCNVRAAERDVQRAVALKMGKAANVLDRVVAGRMHKARAAAASASGVQGARPGRLWVARSAARQGLSAGGREHGCRDRPGLRLPPYPG